MWRTLPADPGAGSAQPASPGPSPGEGAPSAIEDPTEQPPGIGSVAVPDLVGMSAHDARRTARYSELELELEDRPANDALRSRILWQEPEPGTYVPPGAVVTAAVGGRPGVTVPDLHGLDEQESLAILRASGLFPARRVVRRSSSVAQGQILRTRPRAGTSVPLGSRITYVVASPPRPSRSSVRREVRRSRSPGPLDPAVFSLPDE